MDSMEVFKYERDEVREWRFVKEVSDLPGGCRPTEIYPIIVDVRKGEGPILRRRLRAQGFVDEKERYAYVLKKNLERVITDDVDTTDSVTAGIIGDK